MTGTTIKDTKEVVVRSSDDLTGGGEGIKWKEREGEEDRERERERDTERRGEGIERKEGGRGR